MYYVTLVYLLGCCLAFIIQMRVRQGLLNGNKFAQKLEGCVAVSEIIVCSILSWLDVVWYAVWSVVYGVQYLFDPDTPLGKKINEILMMEVKIERKK